MSKSAIVVGGGIGGLAAAVGLHRAGWRVTVLEQTKQFGEIGAGIMMWPNALKALRILGMSERISTIIRPQRSGGLRTSTGRWLSRWERSVLERMLGDPAVGIHRARLHQALLDELPPQALHAGVRVENPADLESADLILAADGIDSGIRRQLFPNHPAPAYAGATAWRGICWPDKESDIAVTWGRGTEFGLVPLEDGRLYWYASQVAPAGVRYDDEKAAVLRFFGSWHAPIRAVIERTEAEAVLHHDIYHLAEPLPSFVFGRTALLGDAAHAMVPNLGQGACQALEDAAVLRLAVERHNDVPTALALYDSKRRPRSQVVARASQRAAKFGTNVSNPLFTALRDTLIRLTPGSVPVRGMTAIAKWDPALD